jgi:hypothetical protein
VDELIEHDEGIESDDAPVETTSTFWGTLVEFVSALLMGIPG